MLTINDTVFEDLKSLEGFKAYVQGIYNDILKNTNLTAEYDPLRQKWAHEYWCEDMKRLEPQVNGEPCALKRAAFLTFWLRREPPILTLEESGDFNALSDDEQYFTDFIHAYGREWCAFKAGYELALYGQKQVIPGHISPDGMFGLSPKFVDDVVEFLKRKNVSPHALYLIFLAIFDLQTNAKVGPR